jgi:hypothetical protein
MMNGTTAERNGAAAGIQTCTKDNDVVSSVSDSPESVAEPTATAPTAESVPDANTTPNPIVSSTKKSRPPYQYDPHKITLRFLFANRDGLTVTVECEPNDTVGQVKGALLSVWPTGTYVSWSIAHTHTHTFVITNHITANPCTAAVVDWM